MNIYQKINENYELLEITRNSEKLPDKTQKISFKIIILLQPNSHQLKIQFKNYNLS